MGEAWITGQGSQPKRPPRRGRLISRIELHVAAWTPLFGLLAFLMLPRWNHPLFESQLFSKFSDDGFILAIESRDPPFKKDNTPDFLEEIGAGEIEEVEY
jgi:hypothetical protein